MMCEIHQVETPSSNSRFYHMRGGGRLTPSPTLICKHLFSTTQTLRISENYCNDGTLQVAQKRSYPLAVEYFFYQSSSECVCPDSLRKMNLMWYANPTTMMSVSQKFVFVVHNTHNEAHLLFQHWAPSHDVSKNEIHCFVLSGVNAFNTVKKQIQLRRLLFFKAKIISFKYNNKKGL